MPVDGTRTGIYDPVYRPVWRSAMDVAQDVAQTVAALAVASLLPGCMTASVAPTYGRSTWNPASEYRITDRQKQEIAAQSPDPATVRFGEMAVVPRLVSGASSGSRAEARRRALVFGGVETPGSLRSSLTPMRRFAAEFESSVGGVQMGSLVDVVVGHEYSSYAQAPCSAAEQMQRSTVSPWPGHDRQAATVGIRASAADEARRRSVLRPRPNSRVFARSGGVGSNVTATAWAGAR